MVKPADRNPPRLALDLDPLARKLVQLLAAHLEGRVHGRYLFYLSPERFQCLLNRFPDSAQQNRAWA